MTSCAGTYAIVLWRTLKPDAGAFAAWVNELRQGGMETFRAAGIPTTQAGRMARHECVDGCQDALRTGGRGIRADGDGLAQPVHVLGRRRRRSWCSSMGTLIGASVERPEQPAAGGAGDEPGAGVRERRGGCWRSIWGSMRRWRSIRLRRSNTGFVREGAFVHIGAGSGVREADSSAVSDRAGGGADGEPSAGAGGGGGEQRVLDRGDVCGADGRPVLSDEWRDGDCAGRRVRGLITTNCSRRGARRITSRCMQVTLAAKSLFVSHSTSLGSKLTRNDLQVFLGGGGAEATLNGLVDRARGAAY